MFDGESPAYMELPALDQWTTGRRQVSCLTWWGDLRWEVDAIWALNFSKGPPQW